MEKHRHWTGVVGLRIGDIARVFPSRFCFFYPHPVCPDPSGGCSGKWSVRISAGPRAFLVTIFMVFRSLLMNSGTVHWNRSWPPSAKSFLAICESIRRYIAPSLETWSWSNLLHLNLQCFTVLQFSWLTRYRLVWWMCCLCVLTVTRVTCVGGGQGARMSGCPEANSRSRLPARLYDSSAPPRCCLLPYLPSPEEEIPFRYTRRLGFDGKIKKKTAAGVWPMHCYSLLPKWFPHCGQQRLFVAGQRMRIDRNVRLISRAINMYI